jgi:hypothetical protein
MRVLIRFGIKEWELDRVLDHDIGGGNSHLKEKLLDFKCEKLSITSHIMI